MKNAVKTEKKKGENCYGDITIVIRSNSEHCDMLAFICAYQSKYRELNIDRMKSENNLMRSASLLGEETAIKYHKICKETK